MSKKDPIHIEKLESIGTDSFFSSPDPEAKSDIETEEWLLFEFADKTGAVLSKEVDEVFFLEALTFIPMAPKMVLGLTSLRGRVFPVIDLIALLDQPLPPWNAKHRYGILSNVGDDSYFVMAVNDILQIHKVPTMTGNKKTDIENVSAFEYENKDVLTISCSAMVPRIREACRTSFQWKQSE